MAEIIEDTVECTACLLSYRLIALYRFLHELPAFAVCGEGRVAAVGRE